MFKGTFSFNSGNSSLLWVGVSLIITGILIALFPMLLVFFVSSALIFTGVMLAVTGYRSQRFEQEIRTFRVQNRFMRWP